MGRGLSHKEWEGIYHRARHSVYHMGLTETLTKVATYWYYTPERIHRFDQRRGDRCCRECGEMGTLEHILWGCPAIQPYWSQVLNEVDLHLDTQLQRYPSYILLGLPNPLTYPLKSQKGRLIAIALGAAIQNFLIHWRSTQLPSHTGWLQRLKSVLGMEKLTLTVAGRGSEFLSSLCWCQEFRELTCPRYLRLLHLPDTQIPDAAPKGTHKS